MEFCMDWLTDPQCFAVNRLPARSNHRSVDGAGNSRSVSLNGRWAFCYAQTPEGIPTGFQAPEYDSTDWDTIAVPGYIQMQGNGSYGTPHYVNTMYPWDGHEKLTPPQIPADYNPVGSYRRAFTVPEQWGNDPVLLRFDGVETAVAVWCNGQFVGYSEDSFTPAEFDLTPMLLRGQENLLAVNVFRFTSASWLEDQDFWRFSGIFRDVTLFTHPRTTLWDVKLSPSLDDTLTTGTLTAQVTLRGELSGRVTLELEGQSAELAVTGESCTLTLGVQNPRLWSAEQPELYRCALVLRDSHGAVLERTALSLGFRRFELKDGLMRLNGKRIVFKGVNRHEWNCRTGRVVSHADMLTDIETMKRHNINAVRTSHYPNCPEWYELCDRYGVYVIDEMNLETHGTWQKMGAAVRDENTLPGDNLLWQDAVLDRANSMAQRDKNHPSVLIWSCGNESCGGSVLHTVSQFFRRTDPTRLVHYEGIFHDRRYPGTSDMESQMYTPVAQVVSFLEQHPEKPFIMCEYAHAMGNSCGALHKYTDLADTEPRYQGGFIWDYIDQAILTTNDRGEDYMAYGGDFGDRPTDGNFCGNGLVYADRAPTPKLAEVWGCYRNFDITVTATQATVCNRSLFTDLSGYMVRMELHCAGVLLTANEQLCACPPGGQLELPVPFAIPQTAGEYTVDLSICLREDTLWAQAGHCVAAGQTVVRIAETAVPCTLPVTVVAGDVNIGVRGKDFSLIFARDKGLISYRYGERELLRSPVQPNFWRAPTDNDRGWRMPHQMASWKTAGLYALPTQCEVQATAAEAVITADYRMPDGQQLTLCYRVTGDGRVAVTMTWLGDAVDSIPEFGLQLTLPMALEQVDYYGMGAQENYSDRLRGARLGRFGYRVDDALCPYLKPQESGGRTGVRWARVTDSDGHGILLEGDDLFFSALRHTPHEVEAAMHSYELPPVCKTVVRCALGQMGVAGDDSWGAEPHPEYRLPLAKGTAFTFAFRGI